MGRARLGLGIRGALGARTHGLAAAVFGARPFGHVAVEIEDPGAPLDSGRPAARVLAHRLQQADARGFKARPHPFQVVGVGGVHEPGVERIATLAGGSAVLMKQLKAANEKGDYQWACQLADYLLVLGADHREQAIKQKIIALRGLADRQLNAPARNYYLSSAMELENK